MSSNRADSLHAPRLPQNKVSKSESQREGKVGTLGKLFGKKKTKRGTQEKDISPATILSRCESNDNVDISVSGSVVYSPAEFLPGPRASVDSTSSISSSAKSGTKKRAAPLPPLIKVRKQELLPKGDGPGSPQSERSLRSFSSSSSIGTPPTHGRQAFISTSSPFEPFDKRDSAVSLPDMHSNSKGEDAPNRASSCEGRGPVLTQMSNLSTSSLLAERGIIYSSVEDLTTVAEAVKELPLPQGAPPPKPKRFSASPSIFEELEGDQKLPLNSVDEHVKERIDKSSKDAQQELSASEYLQVESSFSVKFPTSTEMPETKEEASTKLSSQEEEQMTKFKQIYLFDSDFMFAPYMQTSPTGSGNEIAIDTKEMEDGKPTSQTAVVTVAPLYEPGEASFDKRSNPTLLPTCDDSSANQALIEEDTDENQLMQPYYDLTFDSQVQIEVTQDKPSHTQEPLKEYVEDEPLTDTKTLQPEIQKSVVTETQESIQANDESLNTETTNSSYKAEPAIADFSVIREMAKEAICSNHERSSEVKAILKRSMARMMGVDLPIRGSSETRSKAKSDSDNEHKGDNVPTSDVASVSVKTNRQLDTFCTEIEKENAAEVLDENKPPVVTTCKAGPTEEHIGQETMQIVEEMRVNQMNPSFNYDENENASLISEEIKKPILETPKTQENAFMKEPTVDKNANKKSLITNTERKSVTRSNSLQKNKPRSYESAFGSLSRSKSFGAEEWKNAVQRDETDGVHERKPFDFERAEPKDELEKLASLSVVKAIRDRFGGALSQKGNTKRESDYSEKQAFSLRSPLSSSEPAPGNKEELEFLKAQTKLKKVNLPDKMLVSKQEPTMDKSSVKITNSSQDLAKSSPQQSTSKMAPLSIPVQAPLTFAGVGRVMYQSKVMTWKKSTDRIPKKEEEVPARKNVVDDSAPIVESVSSWKDKRAQKKSLVVNDYDDGRKGKCDSEQIVTSEPLSPVVKVTSEAVKEVQGENVQFHSQENKAVYSTFAESQEGENHQQKGRNVEQDEDEIHFRTVVEISVPHESSEVAEQEQKPMKTVISANLEVDKEELNKFGESEVKAATEKEMHPLHPPVEKHKLNPEADENVEEAHMRRHKEVRERTKNLLAKMKVTKAFQASVAISETCSDDTDLNLRRRDEANKIRERRRHTKSTPNIDSNWEIFGGLGKTSETQPMTQPVTQDSLNLGVASQNVDEKNKVNSDKQLKQSPPTQPRVIRKVKRKTYVRRPISGDVDRHSESSTEGLSEDETRGRQHFSGRLDSGFSDVASHSEIDRRILPYKSHPRKVVGKPKQSSPRTSPQMNPKQPMVGEVVSSKHVVEAPPDNRSVSLLDAAELQRIIIQQQEEMHLLRQQMLASQMQASQMQASQMQASQMQASQMQASQIQASQMQASQNQASQMQASQMQASQMQASQMQASQMQASQMQASQMQASQMQASQLQNSRLQTSQIQAPNVPNVSQSQQGSLGPMSVTAASHVPSMPFMYSHPNMMMPAVQQPMFYVPQGMQAPGVGMQGPGVLPMSNYSPYAPFPVQGMLPMQAQMPAMGMQVQGSVTQYPATSHLSTTPTTMSEQKHSE